METDLAKASLFRGLFRCFWTTGNFCRKSLNPKEAQELEKDLKILTLMHSAEELDQLLIRWFKKLAK